MTLDEYLAAPPDEFKAELVYGERVVSPSPTKKHQDLLFHLVWLLKAWTKDKGLGEVCYDLDMVLDEEKNLVYRPDLVFLANEHADRWRQGRLFGPADLAVEILSPSDQARVLRRKFADYERYAVAWYWIVDPEAGTIEENQLVEGAYQLRTEITTNLAFEPGLFPGLRFRLAPLLRGDTQSAVEGPAKGIL